MYIKALTVWNPYAFLLVTGDKEYETRSWATTHRGLLAIHAAKKWDSGVVGDCRRFKEYLEPHGVRAGIDLHNGCVLSIAELVGCFSSGHLTSQLTDKERSMGDFSDGRYGWKIRVVYRLPEPIPVRGNQGLWNWKVPSEIIEKANLPRRQ